MWHDIASFRGPSHIAIRVARAKTHTYRHLSRTGRGSQAILFLPMTLNMSPALPGDLESQHAVSNGSAIQNLQGGSWLRDTCFP